MQTCSGDQNSSKIVQEIKTLNQLILEFQSPEQFWNDNLFHKIEIRSPEKLTKIIVSIFWTFFEQFQSCEQKVFISWKLIYPTLEMSVQKKFYCIKSIWNFCGLITKTYKAAVYFCELKSLRCFFLYCIKSPINPCTVWKSRGRVYDVFAKFLGRWYIRAVNIFGGGCTFSGFYCIFIDKFC